MIRVEWSPHPVPFSEVLPALLEPMTTVIRGPRWNASNSDGVDGSPGLVMSVAGPQATVLWQSTGGTSSH